MASDSERQVAGSNRTERGEPVRRSENEAQPAPEIPLETTSFLPPRRPPWSWRELALFLGFALLALFFADFVTLAGYAALRPWMGWHVPVQAAASNTFLILVLQAIFYGLLLGYIYALVVYHHRHRFWAGIRWSRPTARQTVRFFLGGIVLALAVSLAPALLPDKADFPFERMFSSTHAAYALAAFAILVAPFMEELIFRAVLFSIFETQLGLKVAIVGTAVLFAAIHIPEYWGAWNRVLLIGLAGLAFSWARGRTGSLTPSVILHCAYNTTLMAALFFQTHHFRSL